MGEVKKVSKVSPFVIFLLLIGLLPCRGHASTISVTTADTAEEAYQKIESAQAGDIVEIAPGNYAFRVHLTNSGTADNPIILRAQDPYNKPVFTLGGQPALNFPGSYNGGDRGRGTWRISGDYIEIDSIVFSNSNLYGSVSCEGCGSGIRFMQSSNNVTVTNSIFEYNDNGVTGYGGDIVFENCIFRYNGASILATSNVDRGHNIYTNGGTQTLRFCHIHDPVGYSGGNPVWGQNVHSRSDELNIEYCVIENEGSYVGDVMTTSDYNGSFDGDLNILGSLLIEQDNPATTGNWNDTKAFAPYNSPQRSNVNLTIRLCYNTYIGNGQSGNNRAMVRFTGNGGTQNSYLYNNLFYRVPNGPFRDVQYASEAVSSNNWWSDTADISGDISYMSNYVTGSDPLFTDPGESDYSIQSGSTANDRADLNLCPAPPTYEVWIDESENLQSRARTSADDIGAYESIESTVDLTDAVLALQIVSGLEPDGITPDGDANGDGRIGLAEAIIVLRKLGGNPQE